MVENCKCFKIICISMKHSQGHKVYSLFQWQWSTDVSVTWNMWGKTESTPIFAWTFCEWDSTRQMVVQQSVYYYCSINPDEHLCYLVRSLAISIVPSNGTLTTTILFKCFLTGSKCVWFQHRKNFKKKVGKCWKPVRWFPRCRSISRFTNFTGFNSCGRNTRESREIVALHLEFRS